MADFKPLKLGTTGAEQFAATDTINESFIGSLNSSKISDFTEAVQDVVGTWLTDSNTIDFTYNDGGNTMTMDVRTQMSITSDSGGVKLDGDSSTPGNTKYYGTNGSGTRGFYDLPTGIGETYTAGENLAIGDLVYLNSSGQMMKADANTMGKEAIGFVKAAVTSGNPGTMFRDEGEITGLTGLTAGTLYILSNTTTGGVMAASNYTSLVAPDFYQPVGRATSTTTLQFRAGQTIQLN